MTSPKSDKKRHKFSFSLKSTFVIGGFVAIALSVFAGRVKQQKEIVKWIVSQGGSITYSDQFDANGNYIGTAQSTWARILGHDAITSVKEVFFEDQELEGIDPLRKLSGLEALYLNSSSLENFGELTSLRSLKSLSVSDISEPNIAILAKMDWLEHLSLDNCSFELEALGNLSNLKVLEIKRCETIDLSQIVKLDHLERLDLTMVKVKSLDPLIEATSLKIVNLVDAVIVGKSDSIADIQKKLPDCDINEVILGPF